MIGVGGVTHKHYSGNKRPKDIRRAKGKKRHDSNPRGQ